MIEDDLDDTALDQLFGAARAETLPLPAGLVSRVMADADDALTGRASRVQSAALASAGAPLAKPGLFAALSGMFGGSGALAGMLTATVAGLYIGYAQPVEIDAVSAVLGAETTEIDMTSGLYALLEEAP